MPKKKPKTAADPGSVFLRFNAEEMAPLDADLKAMPGIPVTFGAYCKHAVKMYPKLRRLEAMLREESKGGAGSQSTYALYALEEAGL